MVVLGISAFYHDSAAALAIDGRVVAAAQEERFSRLKHDAAFPDRAIAYCLEEAGLQLENVDHVVFYEKPFLKFDRLLENYLAFAPKGLRSFSAAMPEWLGKKLWLKKTLREKFPGRSILFTSHHVSHGASAFYPSPFENAAIVTCDGVGEWATASIAAGNGTQFKLLKTIEYPHSLGLLYSAFTFFTGFKVNSGEYKLMGLAPYGKPKHAEKIKSELIHLAGDGSFQLNLDYFAYPTGMKMTNRAFARLFGASPRGRDEKIRQIDFDLAASVQSVLEEAVLGLSQAAFRMVGGENLCLAGGVALNCVANGRLLREGPFKKIWIQPAAGDAGGAIGAALYVTHHALGIQRTTVKPGNDRFGGSYLGPAFSNGEAAKILRGCGAKFDELSDEELFARTAQALKKEKVVAWFQGRMEFGPRALGNRSILGSAVSSETQSKMNLKIKFRESFRPFAPSVLEEDCRDYFELDVKSPYMMLVAPVVGGRSEGSRLPAVTHVDGSARVQTVSRETNPRFHALISKYKELTGCPVIVNTSFNVRGEPIVCSPQDAFLCFQRSNIDVLVVENLWLERPGQPGLSDQNWKSKIAPD